MGCNMYNYSMQIPMKYHINNNMLGESYSWYMMDHMDSTSYQ